ACMRRDSFSYADWACANSLCAGDARSATGMLGASHDGAGLHEWTSAFVRWSWASLLGAERAWLDA
ncbi:Unknown protein, partial [Striga hermonthica]